MMMNRPFCGRGVGLVAGAALLLVLTPNIGYAQCDSTASSVDESVSSTARLHATTTQQNCTDRTAIVIGWVGGGVNFYCQTGSLTNGKCRDSNGFGNANVTVQAPNGCGVYDGVSDHTYQDSGGLHTIELGRETALNAGSCGGGDGGGDNDGCPECVSPIMISLADGAEYKLTSPLMGVVFDIDASGIPRTVAWTEANSDVAFLAIDIDGDGKITSGKELFGDHTLPGVKNGFDALAEMAKASNGGVVRGVVDSRDPLFAKLLLWTDRNHNGISEPDELRPASEVIADIGLGYQKEKRKDRYGNEFRFQGYVHIRTAPGHNRARSPKEDKERVRKIYDVYLTTIPQ
jgi:hypothetical protein